MTSAPATGGKCPPKQGDGHPLPDAVRGCSDRAVADVLGCGADVGGAESFTVSVNFCVAYILIIGAKFLILPSLKAILKSIKKSVIYMNLRVRNCGQIVF